MRPLGLGIFLTGVIVAAMVVLSRTADSTTDTADTTNITADRA